MTPFERQLAVFQAYIDHTEPKLSPGVADIVQRFYVNKTAYSGTGMGDASVPLDGLMTGSNPVQQGAAVDTANVLSNFLNTVVDEFNNGPQTRAQLASLQIAAQSDTARTQASQNTMATTLLMVGGLGLLAVLALKRR